MIKSKIKVMMILVLLLCLLLPQTAYAANTSMAVAWVDGDGNIIFNVSDHKKTSKYSYRTIGCTITRCIPGSRQVSPNGEFVALSFDGSSGQYSEVDLGNGFIQSAFIIDNQKFKDKIAHYYGSWLSELEGSTGEQIYLKLDSIMCCCEDGVDLGYIWDDGSRTCGFWGNSYWNIPEGMYCAECGGTHPTLKDGWFGDDVISSTPICWNHPNAKDGESGHE